MLSFLQSLMRAFPNDAPRRLILFASAVVAGCGSPVATPVAPVPAPPVARVTTTINTYGDKQALMGLSAVRFDLSRSEGTTLQYFVDFGDGTTTKSGSGPVTGSVVTHTYETAGLFMVNATVKDSQGRTDTAVSQVRVLSLRTSVISVWHDVGDDRSNYTDYQIKVDMHAGRNVTGTYEVWNARQGTVVPVTPFSGTLSGERTLDLVLANGTRFTGPVILNDIETDHLYAYGRHLLLTVQGGSEDGQVHDFTYYEQY